MDYHRYTKYQDFVENKLNSCLCVFVTRLKIWKHFPLVISAQVRLQRGRNLCSA